MNKKGFIKTLEAVIAVVLVLGIMLFVAPAKQANTTTPITIKESQSFILEHITTEAKQRDCIIKSYPQEGACQTLCPDIDAFVKTNSPKGYESHCEICNSASTCADALPLEKSLYTDSRFIATDPPRVLRIVFWQQ